jgi:hypothetical protein
VRDLLGIVRALYAFQRAKGNHGFGARTCKVRVDDCAKRSALAIRKGDAEAHAKAWRLADEANRPPWRAFKPRSVTTLATAVRLASESRTAAAISRATIGKAARGAPRSANQARLSDVRHAPHW